MNEPTRSGGLYYAQGTRLQGEGKEVTNRAFLTAAVLAAISAAGSMASAATVDLTDVATYDVRNGTSASGTLGNGVTWTITSPSGQLTYTKFDGTDSPLTDQKDGVGVKDDEISYGGGIGELLYLAFSAPVTLTGFHFMDLFEDPGSISEEVAHIYVGQLGTVGAPDLTFDAVEAFSAPGTGYRFGGVSETSSLFTFAVSDTNDGQGVPDYALAGFDVELAPVPVPAGLLLLGTGVAALSIARRRRT